jgi:hypothetical protein
MLTPGVVFDYLWNTGSTMLVILVVLFGLGALKARGTLTRGLDVALMAFFLAANPMLTRPIAAAIHPNPLHDFLSKQFVDITSLTKPEARAASATVAPKNLIHIFIESAERTYMNEAEFGDVMGPLLEYSTEQTVISRLVEAANASDMVPLQWSPDGQRLDVTVTNSHLSKIDMLGAEGELSRAHVIMSLIRVTFLRDGARTSRTDPRRARNG